MKVLVVGSGGREHALCWAIWASPLCERLYCAPGNAGIAEVAACLPIGSEDIDGLVAFAADEAIDFVVIGPEAPLVAGLVDRLEDAGVKAFGPTKDAALIESSKGFMKDLCRKYGVPTADYRRFRDAGEARAHIREHGAPLVVKADGLAAGKGVVVAESEQEALDAVDNMMVKRAFGAAGEEVVIEDCLEGEEASFIALVDGEHVLPLASTQDHKRLGEGDVGPNTGGMGAYSPAPVISDEMVETIMERIITPTIHGIAAEGRPYAGVLYAGLMITDEGPKVLEYNVRFGDPESQPLVVRLKSDILPALVAARDGLLNHVDLRWREEAALCVVMATKGYPGAYDKGSEIKGLAEASALDGVTIFHAGTRAEDARTLANGGRVLGITALGGTIAEAQAQAYRAVDLIDWPEGYCRRDIGWRAVAREG
jgi:phosphoribosylamine--glycine ligase